MRLFPLTPDFSRVRRGRGGAPGFELIVDRNVENESDRVADCDRDSRAQENFKLSGVAASPQDDQPEDWRDERDRR